MNTKIEKRLVSLEEALTEIKERLSVLEDGHGLNGEVVSQSIELDLILPEADIGGLRFNEQKVHAVFERQDDGSYQSKDILFLSARNVHDETDEDLLSKYLDSIDVKQAFYQAFCDRYTVDPLLKMGLKRVPDLKVFLPKENRRGKKYHGVDWWYWLADKASAAYFAIVNYTGSANYDIASAVGGCAPLSVSRKGKNANVLKSATRTIKILSPCGEKEQKMPGYVKVREADIIRAVDQWLALKRIPHWRINSGALKTQRGQLVHFGAKGMADFYAIGAAGISIWIECKRPSGGVLSAAQREFLDCINRHGGIGIVVNSIESLEKQFEEAQI